MITIPNATHADAPPNCTRNALSLMFRFLKPSFATNSINPAYLHIRAYHNRCMEHVLSEWRGSITVSQHVLPFMLLEGA